MKKIITQDLDCPDLDGSLDSIIEALIEARVKYKDFDNLRIYEECAYEGGYYHYLRGDVLETDEQESIRVCREKEYERIGLERDRKQYESLKAKFEN